MDLASFQDRIKHAHRKWFGFAAETVTVYPAPRLDSFRFDVPYTHRFELTKQQLLNSHGTYVSVDRTWWVWQQEIDEIDTDDFPAATAFEFKIGDVIKDAEGVSWTILNVEYDDKSRNYHLTVRDLVIVAGLADSITIMRADIVKGEASETFYDYDNGTPIVTNLACLVQPIQQQGEDRLSVMSTAKKFTVVLAQPVDLILVQDQIRATLQDGTELQLKWTSYRNTMRIDELPVLECERI